MRRSNGSLTAEKQPHPLQNTVMALPDQLMIVLGRTFRGHHHDALMLQHALPPELEGCTDRNVRVDLGYRGMKPDDRGAQIALPTRKPRQSHKPPTPQCREEPKAATTALSRVRIVIEHAIGGMQRSNILVHTLRNRLEHFEDDVIGICARLWNLVLSY